MRLNTSVRRPRGLAGLFVLFAAAGVAAGCPHPYTQGRIYVDKQTKQHWDSSEKAAKVAGDSTHPIPFDIVHPTQVPPPRVDITTLGALRVSDRHGANDKRLLSRSDTMGGRVIFGSSGVVAEITLVKGIEYKSETDFQKGWLPLAIIDAQAASSGSARDPSVERPVSYAKLQLRMGRSWIFVRKLTDSTWAAALLWIVDGKVHQDSLYVTTAPDSLGVGPGARVDPLEPAIGARFMWQDKDESIWAYCGGKCCRITAQWPT